MPREEKSYRSRSKSLRSISRSPSKRSVGSDRKDNDRRYIRDRRSSRSDERRYKRKTSRDNSAENTGNVVYISGLSRRVRDSDIREKLEKYGKVVDINIVRDPFTKESRGFGFFCFESRSDAKEAIENLNKTEFEGREITVEMSKRNRPHKPTPGAYLGPNSTNYKRGPSRRSRSNERRRYRSRSRSRSRSNRDYRRDYRNDHRRRNDSEDRYRSRDRS